MQGLADNLSTYHQHLNIHLMNPIVVIKLKLKPHPLLEPTISIQLKDGDALINEKNQKHQTQLAFIGYF